VSGPRGDGTHGLAQGFARDEATCAQVEIRGSLGVGRDDRFAAPVVASGLDVSLGQHAHRRDLGVDACGLSWAHGLGAAKAWGQGEWRIDANHGLAGLPQ
jgi:hypothetical protein